MTTLITILIVWCAIALILAACKCWHGLRRYYGRYQINQMLQVEREAYHAHRRSQR